MREPDSGRHRVLGIDVGGANLKFCDTSGQAESKIFPLWQSPERLGAAVASGLREFQHCSRLAVTMTGELADCFVDRRTGVGHIVQHVAGAASQFGADEVWFYGTDGGFHSGDDAKANPDIIAAANWHALASYAARSFPAAKTVIDIGSTTTDIIPVADGHVSTAARTDHDRLVEGSLVYVGCRRTPVCSLVDRLTYRGQPCPVMNEVFATIDDAMLVLGLTAEDEADSDTADRRPRIVTCAVNRLARMIGLDQSCVSIVDARPMATEIADAAADKIDAAFGKIHRHGSIVIAGHGDRLLRIQSATDIDRLSDHINAAAAQCAPSYAVAELLQGQAVDARVPCDG